MAAGSSEDLQSQTCSPSEALVRLFRTCSIDPTEEVESSVDQLLKGFIDSCRSTTTDEKKLERLEHCRYESKLWYYKILEGLLQVNDQSAQIRNISIQSLVENKSLQRCLGLCSLEITLYSRNLAFDFDPRLLQIFNIAPYNFWKALVLVLQTKVDLALNVTDHLIKVEEMLIDDLVWTGNSPLWEEIRANEGVIPACHQAMLPKGLEDPMRREQPDYNQLQVEQSSDQQTSLNKSQRNIFLYIFTCQVYRLMHRRLTDLCSSLNLPEEMCRKIWTCFEYSLVHHFDILRNAQLHWLLLCATHDLTKDIKGLSFKHIVNSYKRKHMSKNVPTLSGHPEKCHSDIDNKHKVRLPTPNTPSSHDQEDDAITSFYSQVYTPVMGLFVKKFVPAPGTETPPLSPYPTPPPASTRRYRLRPGYNIFVSQYNKSTSPQQQPRGLDYFIQSSPSQRLDEINSLVSSGQFRAKRALPFTSSEDDDGEGAGPSAKMSRKSILMIKMQEIKDDRRQSKEQLKTGPSHKNLYI